MLLEAEPMAFYILCASSEGLLHEIARIQRYYIFPAPPKLEESKTVPGGREVAGTSVGFSFIPASL